MSSMQEKIFRSAALARRANPEGLDAMLETTTVPGWISLTALTAVVAGALVWGVLGRVPQVVDGEGIMVSDSGVFQVQAPANGQIDSMMVHRGDTVRRGQVIAMVAQPELRTTISQLEASLEELTANRDSTAALLQATRRMALSSIREQQRQAREAVDAADARIAYLDARIARESVAVAKGLLPRDQYQSTVAERAETQLQRLSMIARTQELGASEVQGQITARQSLFQLNEQIRQTANQLVRERDRLAEHANVTSPYEGLVVELLADAGQNVWAGTPLITVVPEGSPEVLLFIPLEGKRIRPGMRAQMVPGGVRPEETGYFLGEVREVSPTPLSGDGLDRYLKNEVLVEQFSSQGGAYLVEIDVLRDPTTDSGFKWTSRKGAEELSFGSGTLVSGKIIVEQTSPLALIMPAIRRWLRG